MDRSDEKRLEKRQRHFIMGVALLVLICIVVSVAEFHTAPKQSRPKIGLVMRGAKDDDGWNKVQYEGLKAAAKELGMDVIVKENALRSIGEYRKILNSLVSQGVQRVVVTWHRYPPEMRELFRSLATDGRTILLASHNIADIDALCDTVCEMDAGGMTMIREERV